MLRICKYKCCRFSFLFFTIIVFYLYFVLLLFLFHISMWCHFIGYLWKWPIQWLDMFRFICKYVQQQEQCISIVAATQFKLSKLVIFFKLKPEKKKRANDPSPLNGMDSIGDSKELTSNVILLLCLVVFITNHSNWIRSCLCVLDRLSPTIE